MKLKACEDIEKATSMFLGILQQAARAANPKRNPSSPVSNLPSDIKVLVATKRRARSMWQKTYAPDTDVYLITQATNKRPPTQGTRFGPHHSTYDTRNATRKNTNSPALINGIDKLEYLPVLLKHAKIVMIQKSGNTTMMLHRIDQSDFYP
jgi:hypothetical protein